MERPGVGLSVILRKGKNEVLLGKRKGSHGEGKWAFPGGHLEKFEYCRKGILREMKEETGLDANQFNLIDEYPIAITNDFFVQEDKHYITLFFRADYMGVAPKLEEPDKCEEWKWFEWQKLSKESDLFVPVKNLLKLRYNPFEGYNPFLK